MEVKDFPHIKLQGKREGREGGRNKELQKNRLNKSNIQIQTKLKHKNKIKPNKHTFFL
jgi:hypothetical protein